MWETLTLQYCKKFSAKSRDLDDGVPESQERDAKNGLLGLSRFIIFTGPYPRSCGLSGRVQADCDLPPDPRE